MTSPLLDLALCLADARAALAHAEECIVDALSALPLDGQQRDILAFELGGLRADLARIGHELERIVPDSVRAAMEADEAREAADEEGAEKNGAVRY